LDGAPDSATALDRPQGCIAHTRRCTNAINASSTAGAEAKGSLHVHVLWYAEMGEGEAGFAGIVGCWWV
jgi:hypothetical protein